MEHLGCLLPQGTTPEAFEIWGKHILLRRSRADTDTLLIRALRFTKINFDFIWFVYFRTYLLPDLSNSSRIDLFCFQAGGYRMWPNLALVFRWTL